MREAPVEVTAKYVHGVTWPARKNEVLTALERNGAPADVLDTIRSLEDERFAGPNAVHQALWNRA